MFCLSISTLIQCRFCLCSTYGYFSFIDDANYYCTVATPGIFLKVFLGELALLNFFFFRFSVTIFSFLDFSSIFFFFSFFFLLESNVMITVLDSVSVCLLEQNILVLIYFNVPFQGVSRFLKKIKNNIYLYFLIQHKIIDPNN